MRNRKLFILISLILISSLIFVGCGKKSNVEEKGIEDENIVVEDEKEIDKKDMDGTEEIDVEDVEEDASIDTAETIESEKESEKQNSFQSSKITSKDKEKTTKETKETKEKSSNIAEKTSPFVTIIIVGPEDVGTILDTTEVELKDGDTVFDILKQVVKDNSIQMEYKGRKSSIYIQGIHNIYEFDKGPESGWVYRVNGEISQVSCGTHKLNDGDKIEWLYTTDLGREFGAPGGGK